MSIVESSVAQYIMKDSQNPDSAVVLAATDPHGRVIGSLDGGPAATEITKAHIHMAAEAPMLGDKIFSVANEFIVTEQVWRALQAISATDHLHAIKAMVINTGREPVAKVRWLVPIVSHDALHRELARYRKNAGSQRITRVMHWALNAENVPPVALWHETNGRWFASRAFYEMWARSRYIGARFEEVAVA